MTHDGYTLVTNATHCPQSTACPGAINRTTQFSGCRVTQTAGGEKDRCELAEPATAGGRCNLAQEASRGTRIGRNHLGQLAAANSGRIPVRASASAHLMPEGDLSAFGKCVFLLDRPCHWALSQPPSYCKHSPNPSCANSENKPVYCGCAVCFSKFPQHMQAYHPSGWNVESNACFDGFGECLPPITPNIFSQGQLRARCPARNRCATAALDNPPYPPNNTSRPNVRSRGS